jgi:hypothetical protein
MSTKSPADPQKIAYSTFSVPHRISKIFDENIKKSLRLGKIAKTKTTAFF